MVDFAQRSTQIAMLKDDGSITLIQTQITNTRLGHGRPNKKQKLCNEGFSGGESL